MLIRKSLVPFTFCAALCFNTPAKATILTFDIFDPRYTLSELYPEGFLVNQEYGDRVTGSPMSLGTTTFHYGFGAEGVTPNVQVSYGPFSIFTGGPSLWRYDYGDLQRILYQGSTNTGVGNDYDYLEITLFADPGFDVLLYGFDLGGWFQTGYTINGVAVYNSQLNLFFPDQNRIFHDPNALVQGSGPSHSSYSFGTPLRGNVITIFIDANNLGATSEQVGIDNIRFGQDAAATASIPEPASLILTAAGIALLALRRRFYRESPIRTNVLQ